jgi:bla regulator protein blaR1
MRVKLGFLVFFILCGSAIADERVTAYVFVHGSTQSIMTSSTVGIREAVRIRKANSAPFLWFRQGGSSYLIRDRATLDAVAALFASSRRNEPALARLHARLDPLERRQDRLEHELDALEDADDDDDSTTVSTRDSEKRATLERQLREIEPQLRDLEREEERLDAEDERLEREAEKAMMPILERSIHNGIAKKQ